MRDNDKDKDKGKASSIFVDSADRGSVFDEKAAAPVKQHGAAMIAAAHPKTSNLRLEFIRFPVRNRI